MQLIRALELFVHDFHREDSAQISFLAVAGVICFVGLLSMVINTNDVITERVHMQDVADVTVLSAASWTARGLNTISYINVLNSKLVATAILLNALNDALPVIIAIARVQEAIFRACTGVPIIGVGCAIAATAVRIQIVALEAMKKGVEPMARTLSRCPNGALWTATKGLETAGKAVRQTFGGIGIAESVLISQANGATFGIVVNGALTDVKDQLTLPVNTTKFEDFCPFVKNGGPGYELQGYACDQGPMKLGRERIKDNVLVFFPNLAAGPVFSGMVSKNSVQIGCGAEPGEDSKIPVRLKDLEQCQKFDKRARWSHLWSKTRVLGPEHANLDVGDFVPWEPQNASNASGGDVSDLDADEIAGGLGELGLPTGGAGGPSAPTVQLGRAVQFIDPNTERPKQMRFGDTVDCDNPTYPFYQAPGVPPDYGFSTDNKGTIGNSSALCLGFAGANCKRIDQWNEFKWYSGKHVSGLRTGNRTTGGYFIRVTKREIEPTEEGGDKTYVYIVETVSLVDAGTEDMTQEEFAKYLEDNKPEGYDENINTEGSQGSSGCGNKKPLPWMLENTTAQEKKELEERLRFIGVVYLDTDDSSFFWSGLFEERPPKIIAYAQAQVYNHLSEDTFTQDWRVRLEQASLLEDFVRSGKASGKAGKSTGLGQDFISAINNH